MSAALPLTARQRETYDAIARFMTEHGRSPTWNELRTVLVLKSKSSVTRLLTQLRSRGVLDWDRHRAASIVLREPGTYALPPDLVRQLEAFCARTGERPMAFIVDAVTLHLDEHGPRVSEDEINHALGGG